MNKKPIRVLHVVGGMNNAGLEAFIMNIYRKIDREKIQFDFAVLNKNETYYFEEIKSLGGKIYIQDDPKVVGLKKFEQGLYKTIQENGPYECVHSHIYYFNGSILKVAKKCNVRVRISHSHNTKDGKKDGLVRAIYRKYMQKMILKNATHTIGCSEEACRALHGDNSLNNGKSTVLPNAIDLQPYANLSMDKNENRKKAQLPLDIPLIGHIGRFVEEKNHKYLIDIFEAFSKMNPSAKLVLVGDGPLRRDIKKIVDNKKLTDKVLFLGIRKDIPDILGSLDLFVFTSLFEGLGIVVVEAQASGVNCLISDTIPSEVDLNIDLINKLSINEPVEKWTEKMNELIKKDRYKYEQIEDKIIDKGYEINSLVEKIKELYINS